MLPPHRCCCATLASLLLCMPVPFLPCCCCAWRSRITAAVPLLRCCCCAALTSLLPYRSRVAPAACGALASLLLWHSRSHRCCCGALASLLLWRSNVAGTITSISLQRLSAHVTRQPHQPSFRLLRPFCAHADPRSLQLSGSSVPSDQYTGPGHVRGGRERLISVVKSTSEINVRRFRRNHP